MNSVYLDSAFSTLKKIKSIPKRLRNDKQKAALLLIKLGNNAADLQDEETAIHYYKMAKDTIDKYDLSYTGLFANNNLAQLYLKINRLDSVYPLLQQNLNHSSFKKNSAVVYKTYLTLGILSLKKNDFDKAQSYFDKAYNCTQKSQNKKNELDYYKAELQYKRGNLKMAKELIDKIPEGWESELNEKVMLLKSKIYEALNLDKQALVYLNNYLKLRNASDKLKQAKIYYNLQTKYQTQQKEAQILKLSNENIKKEAALAKARFTMYAIGGTSVFLMGLGLLFWQRRRQQQKLEVLASAIKASEAEKQRIGKELHDGIAGSLIKLVYETEGDNLDLSDKLLKTYNEVRSLSHQLNNTPMHDEIFADRIEDLLPENLSGKQFKINIEPRNLKLPEPYGTHLYRIIQELIANNLKYAQATKTFINIVQKGDSLHFEYKDNGTGTDDIKEGNGLKNISDRVTLMKGKLQFQTAPGKGFSLNFTVPHIPLTTHKKQHNETSNYKYSYN